jgi:type II secretory pathway predicted ATPase ExeA
MGSIVLPTTVSQRSADDSLPLTGPQEAAVAKLAYAAGQPAGITLLCGPAGVGKTTVLRHIAARGLPGGQVIWLGALVDLADPDDAEWNRDERPYDAALPDVLLVDEADRCGTAELVDLIGRWRRRHPSVAIVLAGEGRLLSLVAGDARLEQSVRLRATLPPFTLAETRRLLAATLTVGAEADGEAVIRTIHEIAGGVPAIAVRLADMAALVAAAEPGRSLVSDDVETIHRRLCLTAA